MKKITNILIFVILFLTLNVKATGSIDVSPTSISMEKDETKKIQITASNSAALLEVTTSNNAVASLNVATSETIVAIENGYRIFVDKNTVELNVIGNGSGTATINVYLKDAATYDDEDLTGTTKKVNVTVTASTTNPTSTPTPTSTVNTTATPTEQPTVTSTPTPTSQQTVSPTPTPTPTATIEATSTPIPSSTVNPFTPNPTSTPNNNQSINNVPKTDMDRKGIIYIIVIILILTGGGFIIYYNYKKDKNNE